MATPCLDTTLLQYSGTSQAQRVLPALSPGYAKVDERKAADLIVFARKYGAYLNYYDSTNSINGDWSGLMGTDPAVIIASAGQWRINDFQAYVTNLYDVVRSPIAAYPTPGASFKYVFDLVFSLAAGLQQAQQQLPPSLDYLTFLRVAIGSKLSIPLNLLAAYYSSFLGTLIPAGPAPADPLSPADQPVSVPSDLAGFQAQFGFLTMPPWSPPPGAVLPPASLFSGETLEQVIANNFFAGAVDAAVRGFINIIDQTEGYLEDVLTNYPTHPAHYALYLSFLRLFNFAQDHLNDYTRRHLRFYYRGVLRLKPSPGIPDTVHLVFSLQKNSPTHKLDKGTAFKAGKDAKGNVLTYALTGDIVVNQAAFQTVRSLFLVKGETAAPEMLYASPMANSADGQGASLTSPDGSWYPFGDLADPGLKPAAIGNAIASNVLFLNEGPRKITITYTCSMTANLPSAIAAQLAFAADTANKVNLVGSFSIQFTGAKGWFDSALFPSGTAGQSNKITLSHSGSGYGITATVYLNGSAPAVIPYASKLHGGHFPQALPMVELLLTDYRYYGVLKSLTISDIRVETEAGTVQTLSLQNDDGKIDTSRPFKPFGEFPDLGAGFIIGSKEIFQKKLTALTVNFNWQSGSGPQASDDIDVLALADGAWQMPALLAGAPLSSPIAITGAGSIPQADADFSANAAYKTGAINGFIKLSLDTSGHNLATYINAVQSSIPAPSVTVNYDSDGNITGYTGSNPVVASAPTPLIAQTLYCAYKAVDDLPLTANDEAGFDQRTAYFYHLEPFGFREMHPYLVGSGPEIDLSAPDNTMAFLPVWNLDNGSLGTTDTGSTSSPDNGGELWIGLSGSAPGLTQSILFEVSEGSSNPLKPVTKVNWFYLSANNWIPCNGQVIDYTNSLSQSGLVVIDLPGDETTDNTRADAGLLWLKAAVPGNTDAIGKIIAVQPNAARAQFVNDAGIEFLQNIGGGTISKPVVPDAAIKKTGQPYPSSGGAPAEDTAQFDQRVSERLRHKQRAFARWDYERLVLQYFPQIHKAKCLDHTGLDKELNYSEGRPGHVMVVTVPDFSLVTGANPLLPFTGVGLLTDIAEFLQPLYSPFVHLHVCNPQFEGLRFDFGVSFVNNNSNKNYYLLQLDRAIQNYLMPWAFGDKAADIEFGGKIEKSKVLDFVQNQPYVDFVTCFTMSQYIYKEDGQYHLYRSNIEEAIASTGRSILVPYSMPSGGMSNLIASPANCNCNGQ